MLVLRIDLSIDCNVTCFQTKNLYFHKLNATKNINYRRQRDCKSVQRSCDMPANLLQYTLIKSTQMLTFASFILFLLLIFRTSGELETENIYIFVWEWEVFVFLYNKVTVIRVQFVHLSPIIIGWHITVLTTGPIQRVNKTTADKWSSHRSSLSTWDNVTPVTQGGVRRRLSGLQFSSFIFVSIVQ